MNLKAKLDSLRGAMAAAAQEVYDGWAGDGDDPTYGGGGICDAIANEIGNVLAGAGINQVDGGQDGDDHAFLIAYDDSSAYVVDIHPSVYERGSGYSWTKIPGVTFDGGDITIHKITEAERRSIVEEAGRWSDNPKKFLTTAVSKEIPKWLRDIVENPDVRKRLDDAAVRSVGAAPDWTKLYGCGHYGCVFKIPDTAFVLKVSSDQTEGPMQAFVAKGQAEGEYGFESFAQVKDVFELQGVEIRRGKVYVIIREDVLPLYVRGGYTSPKALEELSIVKHARKNNDDAIVRRELEGLDRTAVFLARYQQAARAWYGLNRAKRNRNRARLDELESQIAGYDSRISEYMPYVGQALSIMFHSGTPLLDVHAGNVGVRTYPYGGDEGDRGYVVIFDPGHTPTDNVGEEKKGKIALANPAPEFDSIKYLWRQPDTLSLWGIPHELRPGQSPKDLFLAEWPCRHEHDWLPVDYRKCAPRKRSGEAPPDWIWLGAPGWYGSMSRGQVDEVKAFLKRLNPQSIPSGPHEWAPVERTESGGRAEANPIKRYYVATLLNPVDKKPYALSWDPRGRRLYVVTPAAEPSEDAEVWGQGHLDSGTEDYGKSVKPTGCPRSHTPDGVKKHGVGLGLMLYAGLAIAAKWASVVPSSFASRAGLPRASNGCISSYADGRSYEATKWWESQVERGFAEEDTIEVEGEKERDCTDESFKISGSDVHRIVKSTPLLEAVAEEFSNYEIDNVDADEVSGTASVCNETAETDSITVQLLTFDSVDEAKLILHVREDLDDAHSNLPPVALLDEIDMSDIVDPAFFDMITNVYVAASEESGDEDDAAAFQKFLKRRPFWVPDNKSGAKPFRGYENAGKEYSEEWLKTYGGFIEHPF